MSEDFDGEYGDVVIAVTKAMLPDVVNWLNRHAQIMSKLRKDNEELQKENNRVHTKNKELHGYFREQRERLKPDGPLVSRKVLMMAVELLEDGGVISEWSDTGEDLRWEIKQVTQHEEGVDRQDTIYGGHA